MKSSTAASICPCNVVMVICHVHADHLAFNAHMHHLVVRFFCNVFLAPRSSNHPRVQGGVMGASIELQLGRRETINDNPAQQSQTSSLLSSLMGRRCPETVPPVLDRLWTPISYPPMTKRKPHMLTRLYTRGSWGKFVRGGAAGGIRFLSNA